MVSEDEVVSELNHSLNVVRIVLLQQEKQLGLHCSLVVVLFLILDQLNGDQFFVFMIQALDDLAEGSLSDDLDELESIGDMISFLNAVVALFVIKAVVHQPLQLRGSVFASVFGQVVDLVVLVDLSPLEVGEILVCQLIPFGHGRVDWELDGLASGVVYSELIPL